MHSQFSNKFAFVQHTLSTNYFIVQLIKIVQTHMSHRDKYINLTFGINCFMDKVIFKEWNYRFSNRGFIKQLIILHFISYICFVSLSFKIFHWYSLPIDKIHAPINFFNILGKCIYTNGSYALSFEHWVYVWVWIDLEINRNSFSLI